MKSGKGMSLAYRVATLIDAGAAEERIVAETGASRNAVRRLARAHRHSAQGPGDPSAAETVIIQYMAHSNMAPTTSELAAACQITEEQANRHMDDLVRKGLVDGGEDCPDEPMVLGRGRAGVPEGLPRAAPLLIAQACEGGYIEGEDERSDTRIMMAGHMVDEQTVLIRLDPDETEHMMRKAAAGETPARAYWPSDQCAYVEFTDPIPTDQTEPATRLEGMLIAPSDAEPYRLVVMLARQEDRITSLAFMCGTGDDWPTLAGGEDAAPAGEPQALSRLIVELLAHVAGPGRKLTPAPMNRGQRRRARRGENQFNWMVAVETDE